jgi:hypothetical protein
MSEKEVLQAIRQAVAATAAQGQAVVTVVDLDRYLANLEAAFPETPASLDHLKLAELDQQAAVALHRSIADQKLEMFRSVIASGQNALKTSILINGGAAVALLAFVGHMVASDKAAHLVSAFALPMLLFVAGVCATAVATGLTYVSQALFQTGRERGGNVSNGFSIALVIGSYVAFSFGCYRAYDSIRSSSPVGVSAASAPNRELDPAADERSVKSRSPNPGGGSAPNR